MKARTRTMRTASTVAVVAVWLATPPAADAQLPNASASTLALAGNHTALAREFAAISVNPAGLATYESGFSLAVVPVQARVGVAPITLSDIHLYQGRVIPRAVKESWLSQVRAAGGQKSTAGTEVTGFALTMGHIGVQLSTVAGATIELPPDLVEAALFGNAGRTGEPTDLSLTDASIASFAVTTAAMSVGIPVSPMLSLGLTGKYSIGHGVALGRAVSGAFETDPIRATMDFGMLTSCVDEIDCVQNYFDGGSGLGIDLGGLLDLGDLTLGATLVNVVNTFQWDETNLAYRPGTLLFEAPEDSTVFETDFDEQGFLDAPASLQETLRSYTFGPGYRFGAALDVSPMLTITSDVHGEIGDGKIALGPRHSVGLGAELRLPVLQLRGGLAKITDGSQYGAGATLVLGPVNLSAAGGMRRGDNRNSYLVQAVLSFAGR